MPEISSVKSPLSRPSNIVPDFNFGDRSIEPLGSMDTWLSRVTGTNYDKGFNPYKNQQDNRFENTNWKTAVANNLGALASKTANGVVQMAGGVTSLIASPISAFSSDISFTDVFDKNPLNTLADGIDGHLNELFPRTQRSDFNSKGFLEQLARPGELLSANIDSLAFLAQSFVGAGLLSKLNLGTKLATKLAKVQPSYKYLSEITGPNAVGMADKINFFATNELLTFNEAAMEAKDAVESLSTTLRQKRDLGEVSYTDEEIAQKANMAGINTFWLNALTLSVTNGAFTKLVSPLKANASNKLNPYDLKFLDKEFKAPVYSSKFEKFLSDKGYASGAVSKAVVENIISEGAEESMQYSIQKINSQDGISFLDASNKYLSDIATMEIANMSDPERAKAAGLGALIGGLGVGGSALAGTRFKNIGPINEANAFRTDQSKAIKDLNESYAGFTSLNRFKDQEGKLYTTDGKFVHEVGGTPQSITKEEFTALATEKGVDPTKGGSYSIPGQLSFDDEGNPNISPAALHDLIKDTKVQGELDDLVEKELASANPDQTKLRLYKMERLKTAAIASHKAGVMDIFQEQLETLSQDSVIGLNTDVTIKDELELAKDYASRLNSAFLTIDNSLVKEDAKKVAYDKAGRIISLDYAGQVETAKNQALAENLTPEQQALGFTLSKQLSIYDQLDEAYRGMAYSSEAMRNFNKFLPELNIDEIANAPSKVKDYARSITNLNYIIDAREELGRTLDTILSGGREKLITPFEGNGLPFRAPKSAKEYEYYESRVGKKLNYDDKVEDIMSQYNSGMFNELVNYLNITDPVEGASELSNFVTSSIERGVVFSDDVKEGIASKVDALKTEVAKLEEIVRGPIEAEGYTLEGMFQEAADAYLDEDVADAFKLLTELKAALAPLNNFSIDQLPTRELNAITPKYILERLMEPAKTLVASAYIDEEINPAFTDEAAIDIEIEKLQAINDNVLPTRDDLKGLGLPQLLKELIKLRSDYQDLKKDREAKNAKQDAMYASFVLNASRESTIASTLSEEDRDLIDEIAKEDAVTAALIASDRITDIEAVKLRQNALDTDLAILLEKLGVRNATGLISMMKRNPIRGLSGIISRLQFINSIGGSNVEAFTTFTINYDLVDLMDAQVSDDYKALRDIFGKYFGLWEIANAQNSDLTTKQALLNYQKFLNAKPITPTSAQFRTSLQIARILNSPKESTDGRVQVYQNIALLKAPAGAGKTSVVLPLATQLSGLPAGSIYTAAPYAPGAKAIATSTSTTPKTVTELVEDLKNNNISEDTKVIVVDEITTLSYDALHALAGAFTAFLNRNQERSIKLVGMYDPLQVNESDNGVPVLDREFYSLGSGYETASEADKKLMREGQSDVRGTLPFIHNVTDVSPLATTFRSNVAAVIDLQNLFKGTSKVVSPATTASSNPNNTTKDILGTYSGSSTEIIKILKSSYATNNGATTRSRVIITDDVNKWQPILDQQGIVGVDVITVEQSSGITRDEVYIDIKVDNKPSFNRRMYTAISRASKFVYLGNYPTNFTEDASIPEKVKKAEDLNTSRNDSTKDLVKEQLKYFGVETAVEPVATPVAETVEEERAEEITVDLPFDIDDPVSAENATEPTLPIPPQVVTLGEGTHELSFPSSTAFNTYGKLGPIKAGDEVMIVRDNSDKKNRYLIVQPNPANEDYRVIGIFSDEEVPKAEAALGLVGKFDKLIPYTFLEEHTDLDNSNTFMRVKGNIKLESAYTLQVSGNSVDMKFHYDNVPTTLNESNAGQVILKALEDMYPGLVGIANADDIRNNPTSFVRYRVFSSDIGARKELMIGDVEDLLNVPLMIIDGVMMETGKKMRPLFIRLNSQILNDKNTRAVDIEPLREFTRKMSELEELIKTATFPSAIYNLFNSEFSFKIGEANVYFPFHKFIRAIAHPSEKSGMAEVASKELNEKMKKAGIPELLPIDVKTLDPRLVTLAKEVDKLIHGTGVFKGEAQVALDKLATANFLVELPNGKTLVLRDYKAKSKGSVKDGKLEQDFVLTGPSLLGAVTFEHSKGKSRNSLIPKLLIAKMERYLKKAYDKYSGEESKLSELPSLVKESNMPKRYKALADMLIEKDTAHLFPLTLSDIDQLINKGVDSSGDFTNINQDFGLRTPISRKAFGKSAEGAQDIEGLFETTFQGITRTRIGVTFEGGSIQRDAEIAKTERVPNPYIPFYRAVDSAKSLEEALALAPQFSSLEFNVPIEEAIAMRYDEVSKDTTYLTVSHAIRDLLARVRNKSLSLKDRLIQSLESSSTALDFGHKYAARDFVRASIYAEMMPEIYNIDPFAIVNLSRLWVEAKYDSIYDKVVPFSDKAMELQKVFVEIFEDAGIPFTMSTNPVEFVENVVVASTEFRAKQKTGFKLESASPKQVDEFNSFIDSLDDVIDLGEERLEQFIAANKDKFARFVEITGITQTDINTVMLAVDVARDAIGEERSMRRTEGAEIGDLINEEGAVEIYNSFFNAKTLGNLFKKKTTEAFNVITEAYMQFQLGKENWGLFKDGVVYVTKDSDNKVGSKVVRHEAFHKVFWNYLTKEEQVRALSLAEDRYGKNTKLELEERLAEDFASYRRTGGIWSAIKSIFRKIARFFNFTYNNLTSLEILFNSIEDGYYATRKSNEVNIERDLKIAKYWKSIDMFTTAKSLFLDTFVRLQDESRNTEDNPDAPFRTFDSSIEETYELLKKWHKGGQIPLEGDPEYIRRSIEPLVSSPKAYAEFIDQYFSNANAKAAKRQRLAERDLEKVALQETLKQLDEDLRALDTSSDEYSAKKSEQDEVDEDYKSLLSAELFEAELRDPEEKLTGMVKARLIGIKYSDEGKVVYAPLSKSYGAMLSFVNQADTSSLSALLSSLQDRVKYYFDANSVKNKGVYNTVRKATASYLVNLIQDIRENDAPRSLNFFRDVSSLNEYAIFGKQGQDTSNITHTEALRYPDKYLKIERELNDSASVFAERLLTQTNMSMAQIKQAYRLFEDVNFIRSLTAAAVSMRKMKPYVGSSRWDFYNWVNRYTQMGRNGQTAAIETRFVERFADYVQKTGTPFNTDFLDRMANASTPETKLIVFNKLFRSIGMGLVSSQLSNAQVEDAFSRLKNSVAGINEALKSGNPYEVIDNQGSLISVIVELFENSASLIDVSSFIRGDGKKGYGWSDASLQSSLLNYFDKMLGGKPQDTGKPNHVKVETVNGKKVITSTSPFLKMNPFITGKNKLRSFVDHDSLKKLSGTSNATFLYGESLVDYHNRNFIFGFLNRLRSSRDGYYFQFLPVPANRTSMQGVEVGVLQINAAKQVLTDMIENEKNRPDLPELANNKNYQKNKGKFFIPGLSGKTTDVSTKDALAQIDKRIAKEVETVVKEMMGLTGARKVDMDPADVAHAFKQFSIKIDNYKSTADFKKELAKLVREKASEKDVEAKKAEALEMETKVMTALVTAFYYNSIVNQYALSQIIYGDNVFYKNKEDLTKRIQVFTATGDTFLVDDRFGLPKTTRIAIMKDVVRTIPKDMEGVRADSYRETLDETDAEGFMLPEFYELLARTQGIESNTDVVMKLVYAGMDAKGIPSAVKYSVKVLTDQLVKDYPHLERLREQMRKEDIQQATFVSAVKVSTPENAAEMGDNGVSFNGKEGFGDSVMVLDSKNLRSQLNPAKSIDTSVANPSQVTSMMNTNGLNTVEAEKLYDLNSLIMELGGKILGRQLRLSEKGGLTKASKAALVKRLIKITDGVPNGQDINYLLSYISPDRERISTNLPIIQQKMLATIASMYSTATTAFRFSGSKMVLQSEFGTYSSVASALQYKDAEGYTEVLLPEAYKALFKEGDIVGGKNAMMAFRIPSTNYHSALALKVKGFYKTPIGAESNVIIAPSMIVYYHGSDFDVDTLFLIKKEANTKDTINLNELLQQYGLLEATSDSLIAPKGEYFGFNGDAAAMVEGLPLHEYLFNKVSELEDEIVYRRARFSSATIKTEKARLNTELEQMEKDYYTIIDVATASAKNAIVDLFSKNIADPKNRTDLLTPIYTRRVSSVKTKNVNDFYKDLASDKELLKDLTEAGIITIQGNKVTFKGQEFADAAAFAEYVKRESTSVFEDFDAPLAKIIAEKYSETGEDSVAEMFTKMRYEKAAREGRLAKGAPATLEYVTQEDIDKYLYPEGQAQDYVTQSRIHANTYAGVKATGISANFSKMLAYLFSATPVTEILDSSTGESYFVDTSTEEGEKAFNKLKTTSNAASLKDLLRKNRNLKVSKRGEPKVKEAYQFIMNNHTFKTLSRFELNRDGSKKTLFSNVKGRELFINVFETIDTIINLAIDNVKEQKLFILGLTNSNANAMMTAISFGAPLNDVARLFNTDAIVQESKGGRIKADKLMAKVKTMLEEVTDAEVKDYLLATGQDALLSTITGPGSLATNLYKSITKIGTDSEVLDGIYTENPLMLKHKKMSDIAALANLAKLVDMGNESFAYSRIFSLLRKMPSKKYTMDAIAAMPLKYVDIPQIEVIDKVAKGQMIEELTQHFKASEEYTSLPTEEARDKAVEQLLKELDKPNAVYSEELKRVQRSWFLNRVGRNKLARLMNPSSASVFENVTILSIPHVYTAWRMLNNLIRVVEQTFALHSPRVSQLAKNVVTKLKTDGAWTSADFQEIIQNNFIKFLTSNLKVQIDGDLHDMSVDPNLTFTSSLGVTFSGEEAWTQRFISQISPKLSTGNNQLLKSIEEKTERPSANDKEKVVSKKLLITADKVGDDEQLEILKRDFKALDKELQIDLFKYALLTSGLYYGRTNFSLIFPVEFALGFDKALNARLETVLTTSNIKTDINMRVIEDQFLYQFVRNNSNVLSYINSKIQPIAAKEDQVTINGNKKRIFHGVDSRPYGKVYFDLKFPKSDGTYYDEIIKRYGQETYTKLDTPEETEFVYYRVFTVPMADKTFSFDDADLDVGLNLSRLKEPGLPLLTKYRKTGNNVIQIYTSQADYAAGDIVYLNPNVTKLTELKAYEVKAVEEDKVSGNTQSVTYRLVPKTELNIDLSHKKLVQELKDRPYYAEIGSSSKSAEVVTSQKEAIQRANKKGVLSIVGTLTEEIPGVYSIDLTKPIEDVLVAVQNIPNSKKYVVDKTFIDTLFYNNPSGAVKVATALYAKTGFEHNLVGRDEEDLEIEAKIARAFQISDLTSSKMKAGQSIPSPIDGLLQMQASQFEKPRAVKEGSIVYLGKSSDQDIFGHVVNVEQEVVKLSLLDSAIFGYLSKQFYGVEELNKIKEKLTC